MDAVIYSRVSTMRQVNEGVSLKAQEAAVRAWCDSKGHEIIGIFADEGISGKCVDNRPELHKALSLACKRKGILVAYSLSRLARSTIDALDIADRLNDAGANLVSLSESIDTTSPMGEFIYTIFAALGQLERKQISVRTKEALAYKRSNGYKTGGTVPFGYDVDAEGRLIENNEEQKIIDLIRSLNGKGSSLRKIADELHNRGIKTKTGNNEWQPKAIQRILKTV